jgi:hypothetical protein
MRFDSWQRFRLVKGACRSAVLVTILWLHASQLGKLQQVAALQGKAHFSMNLSSRMADQTKRN